eukprot:TRINITY_DN4698_c0_g1_i1.p1 TRINITY_DN4698_c0_g1~~TRINITY_DN4698_c0_g1_i1.p1  ORF type:complete len:252 (+),score=48.94 TRINITY_DN4698_c0_g1_i1:41-757(+)
MTSYCFNGAKLRKPDWTSSREPTVIISCGSFSPITFLHLRLFEMARDELQGANADVLGGFASPVADAYGKKGLAAAEHRLAMVDAALASSDWIALDTFEASQSEWTPTRQVLDHFQQKIDEHCGVSPTGAKVRVRLVCGSDLLDSFNTPDLWKPSDMRTILQDYGICVIERDTNATGEVIFSNDLLHECRKDIVCVPQHIVNDISSTKVRLCIKRGLSIKYLTPDPVIDYILQHKLYQ